jgi:hypothetical protein
MGEWRDSIERYLGYVAQRSSFLPGIDYFDRPPRLTRRELVEKIPLGKWHTRYGEVMNIVDMDDQHLDNTINMLHRWYCHDTDKYRELVEEKERRNEPRQSTR